MIRIIAGIVGTLVAVGVILVGVGFLQVESTLGALDPAVRASIPGTARFDAEERDYTIAFNARQAESLVRDARCTIAHPDESVTRVRGDIQETAITGETIGQFEGKGGPTAVECTFVERGPDASSRIVVTPQREWIRTVGFIVMGAGVFVLLGSVALIMSGARARSKPARTWR